MFAKCQRSGFNRPLEKGTWAYYAMYSFTKIFSVQVDSEILFSTTTYDKNGDKGKISSVRICLLNKKKVKPITWLIKLIVKMILFCIWSR